MKIQKKKAIAIAMVAVPVLGFITLGLVGGSCIPLIMVVTFTASAAVGIGLAELMP